MIAAPNAHFAISVVRWVDTSFDEDSIQLAFDAEPTGVTVRSIECYDASGASVAVGVVTRTD